MFPRSSMVEIINTCGTKIIEVEGDIKQKNAWHLRKSRVK